MSRSKEVGLYSSTQSSLGFLGHLKGTHLVSHSAEQTPEAGEGLMKPSLNQVNGAVGKSKAPIIWLSEAWE